MTVPRVFSYVQYLQGVGHLYRAAHIARAMAKAGLAVDLVSGGVPVPGLRVPNVELHQLTPIKCRDGDFSDLVDAEDRAIDDSLKRRRRDELLAVFHRQRPAVLLVEAFPFGRRQMRFELIPLLEAARAASPRPVIACSVRDVLQVSGKPERVRETLDVVDQYFDHVLVHGDPEFARLGDTFPGAEELAGKTHYTGLVGGPDETSPISSDSNGEILVSAGGGATRSEILLTAAMQARALSRAKDRTWRLLAGPNLPRDELRRLEAQANDGVILESNRSDFPELLAACAVSVSQAGYNTVVDLLHCGCRAVVVPYSARGETEQVHRARRLKELSRAQLVESEALTPQALAVAIDAALAAPPPGKSPFSLSGAENTAEVVSGWLSD